MSLRAYENVARPNRAIPATLILPISALLVYTLVGGAAASLLRYAIVAIAGVVAASFVFVRPRLGVYFLCFYVYAALGSLLPLPLALPLTALLAGATVCRFAAGESNLLVDRVFWWSSGLFLLVCFQSVLFAYYPDKALLKIFSYLKAMALTYLVVQFVRTPGQLRTLALVIFMSSVGTIFLGIASFYLGWSIDVDYTGIVVMRFSGLHADPNYGAAYMCAALPLGVFLVANAKSRWWKTIAIVGVAVCVFGVSSSFSRGAMLSLAIVLVAVIGRELRDTQSRAVLFVLLLLGLILTPTYYWERMASLSQILEGGYEDWSLATRVQALKSAWRLFQDNPVTGIGLGNFIIRSAQSTLIRIVVHNSYLELAVGTGIFGLMAFLVMCGSGLRWSVRGARARWNAGPPWMNSLAYYFGVSLVSTLVSSLFLSLSYRYLMWVPLAGCLVVGNLLRADRESESA